MKKLFCIASLLACFSAVSAIEDNTVEIIYNGSSATIMIAGNISNYVTVNSGNSSHVKITQSDTFAGVDATSDNSDGEIIYILSGNSTDGEFYMEGSFKATIELNGLTLTNPYGAAMAIMNGKRIEVSAKKNTVNTLTDGPNDTYNGAFHCKGHTKFKGKGTLNVVGRSKHAIYSKEYLEIKNLELNITAAPKDGIHCKEYFLMESGTVNINGAADDGIQVELAGNTSTGTTAEHEDEDSGNFYMTDGELTISGYEGKAIKADGSVTLSGGQQHFDITDIEQTASISQPKAAESAATVSYDLGGRRQPIGKGLHIVKQGGQTTKAIIK